MMGWNGSSSEAGIARNAHVIASLSARHYDVRNGCNWVCDMRVQEAVQRLLDEHDALKGWMMTYYGTIPQAPLKIESAELDGDLLRFNADANGVVERVSYNVVIFTTICGNESIVISGPGWRTQVLPPRRR
jgi:hypothetical protein